MLGEVPSLVAIIALLISCKAVLVLRAAIVYTFRERIFSLCPLQVWAALKNMFGFVWAYCALVASIDVGERRFL